MHSIDRPLPKGKSKKVTGFMKGALGGKMMTKLVAMIKMQKTVIKRKLNFQDYNNYLQAAQLENKKHHLEKSKIPAGSRKKKKKVI